MKFAQRNIDTDLHPRDETGSIYAQLLGPAFKDLPAQVQYIHVETIPRQWYGHADVTIGTNVLSRLAARIFGFPTKGGSLPVTVNFDPKGKEETWTRNFGGQVLVSHQSVGTGKDAHLLVERFGPIVVAMTLEIKGNEMHLIPRHWRCFGVPLPQLLLSKGHTFETETDGQFQFHVDIIAPIIGRIVRYQGTLTRKD